MTTSELIYYIKKQIAKNVPKDLIVSKLINVGWHMEDIDEGFSKVESESPKAEIIKPEVKIEPQKNENSKAWVPHNLPILERQSVAIEEQELELPAQKVNKPESDKTSYNSTETPKQKEEFIPTLIPKVVINSFGSVDKDNFGKKEETIKPNEPPKDYSIRDLPRSAMLSSYKSDLMSVVKNREKEETIKPKRKKSFKWIIIILIIIGLIAGVFWVYKSGYINVKSLNFSFIKKEPKSLILNNSKVLASLKSYKTETNIEISFPSFANISAGLISGEEVSGDDKDTISINTLGVIDQNDGSSLSDNFVTIKSSLLQDYITTDIKNNGFDLFVSVPDLSEIVGEDAPESSVVKIKEDQFALIPPLFSAKTEAQFKKLNLYKILSTGIPSYVNNEALNTYNELVNSVEIIEKGQEKIKEIDTYRYSINADRQSAKSLLNEISNNLTLNLSSQDKDQLAIILGAVKINSFDVWIGKKDSNVYQYNIVLEVPLSKIIGFEDKSIGDNKIIFDLKTTYYDFDIPNNIFIPDIFIPAEDFVRDIKELKIRNDVSSFSQLAKSLFNAEGSYGKKPNSSGSCMNPTAGSLFSPTGHVKGAVDAVSSLSGLLNGILKTTGGVGYCYSTTKAWSFTIPISDNYDLSPEPTKEYGTFLCIDNTGASLDISASPAGVICK